MHNCYSLIRTFNIDCGPRFHPLFANENLFQNMVFPRSVYLYHTPYCTITYYLLNMVTSAIPLLSRPQVLQRLQHAHLMLVHILCVILTKKWIAIKILLHGILEDFTKITCCKNKYAYGIFKGHVRIVGEAISPLGLQLVWQESTDSDLVVDSDSILHAVL